jgi:predicted AAA+ superfamily ATPase
MYKRLLKDLILSNLQDGFVNIIYGARRVGKTVLMEQIKESFPNSRIGFFNGDTQETIEAWSNNSEIKLSQLVANFDIIFIDEAQRIPGITLALKIVVDKFPNKKIFVTGSSSLQLSGGTKENLTGRNNSYVLFPLNTVELGQGIDEYKIPSFLGDQLIFGGYPFVYSLSTRAEKENYLSQIVEDYLFKDVFLLEKLERPEVFKKLAWLLALQIGHEVSLNELSVTLGIETKTVSRYLDLLEKSFVIFHLDAYSTNQRNEISKKKKYYFYDLGVRNALVNQFQNIDNRIDVGQLWENFLMVERKKKNEYFGLKRNTFFWRNYLEAEVDFIEFDDLGQMSAFEFKWRKDKSKTPKSFFEAYGVKAEIVNQNNYLGFVK